MVYGFKIAGAAAEAGLDLDGVTRVAQKAADACRSVGAALSSCTVPQAGKPTFQIGEDEMEMGMGIHGEPGVWRDKLRPADAIAEEMMDRLLADLPLAAGDRVSILVNSLGATPPEELYILYRIVKARLDAAGATVVMPLVGRYATSMEMAGVSFTLIKLDAELEGHLTAPCDCAFWSVA
jgi:dihydroxyacetone kinase-like protein